MSKYSKEPEVAVRSDTTKAKEQLRSGGYGKDARVDKEGRQEP